MKFWIVAAILMSCSVVGIIWASLTVMSRPATDTYVQFVEPLPTEYCWNKVEEMEDGTPYWPNACNTAETAKDVGCAQVIIELEPDQIKEYEGWKLYGEPELIGC